MDTYLVTVRRRYPARSRSISFGEAAPQTGKQTARRSYKASTIGYLRRVAERSAKGTDRGVLAIGRRCPMLRRQLRALEWKDREAGIVDKGDDHGPDALVALAAPIAIRHR